MQPIAAYYYFIANEEARNAEFRHRHASVPPKPSGRSRVAKALSALAHPVRRSAGAAA
jgi:cell division protein FtsN